MMALLDWRDLTIEGIPEFRVKLEEVMASLTADLPPNDRVQSEDRMIPGPDGDDLRVRIHRPIDQSEVLPCFYHIHGGGMIIGSVDGEDLQLAVFVEQVGCVVVSVDYRLAPENPNPAPVEDCYAGLVWTAEHADELRIDPTRIAVGGESAGGGLAAATALMARDRNGPDLVLQYLIYPMLDNRNETPSSREFAGDWPGWPREMNYLGWEALLGESTGGDELLPYAAPARSKDLSDLPPTYIDVGGLEVFRDEDIDYAKRLMQAGVDVEFHFTPESSMGGSLSLPQPT